jgi:pentatricopeptide repeat protein
MAACEKCERSDRAMALFRDMQEDGVHPNVYIFSSLISAHAKDDRVTSPDEAFAVFREMQSKFGVAPNVVLFSALVSLCAKFGQVGL